MDFSIEPDDAGLALKLQGDDWDRAKEASQAAELERLLGWPVFGDGPERPPSRGPRRV